MKHLIPLSPKQLENIQSNLTVEPILKEEVFVALAEHLQLLCKTPANPYQVAFELARFSMSNIPQPESLTKYVIALTMTFLAINNLSTRNTFICLEFLCSRILLKRKRAEEAEPC